MFTGVIGDYHDVQFEAQVAFPDGVDVCDVGTLLVHGSHELLGSKRQIKPSLRRAKSGICEGNLPTSKLPSAPEAPRDISATCPPHLSHLFVVMVPEVQEVFRSSVLLRVEAVCRIYGVEWCL